MSPEYLEQLADLADPDQLWKTVPILQQLDLPPDRRRQLDAGIALRRHASHVRELERLIGTGKSLLITPLSKNGTATKRVATPSSHKRLLNARAVAHDGGAA